MAHTALWLRTGSRPRCWHERTSHWVGNSKVNTMKTETLEAIGAAISAVEHWMANDVGITPWR